MNWLFKIYKLKVLWRLYKVHLQRADDWNTTAIKHSDRGDNDKARACRVLREQTLLEAKKIENLIKFM